MRTIMIVSAMAILLAALSGCAPLAAPAQTVESEVPVQAPSLSGTYSSVIPSDNRPEIPDEFGMLAGRWQLTLLEDGVYQLHQRDILRAEGTFAEHDGMIELTDLSGDFSESGVTGVYSWTMAGETMQLQAVDDPVESRRFTLTCMKWQRV